MIEPTEKPEKHLVKVRTEDLKPGMFVVDIGRGWLRHPWKTKRKLITQRHEIAQLVQHNIESVTVDLALSKKIAFFGEDELGLNKLTLEKAREITPQQVSEAIKPAQVPAAMPLQSLESLERRRKPRPEKPLDGTCQETEMPRARQTYLRALDVTRQFMEEARAGRRMNVEAVRENVEDMIDSVFRNRQSLTALLKLRKYDEYTFTHSLNVTALAVAMGRCIDLSREQLANLGLGAMFHDVGKTQIPDKILNKPGKLTDAEFEIMKSHPAKGEAILKQHHQDLPRSVLAVVRNHHERSDATGYPDSLDEAHIDPFVAICGIADVYDALSSDRVYRKGMTPHEALKVIFSLRSKHFPQAWVDRFIQCIGIYPVGTTVMLNNHEIAVVLEVNQASLVRPVIRIVLDEKRRRLGPEKTLDLNRPEAAALDVFSVVDPAKYQIDPASYFPV